MAKNRRFKEPAPYSVELRHPINPIPPGWRFFIMLSHPTFPRKVVWKYLLKGFSPENMVSYIDELKLARNHCVKSIREHIETITPVYSLLQKAVRDYHADELRFTQHPVKLTLLRDQEVIDPGSEWLPQEARKRDPSANPPDIDRYILANSADVVRLFGCDPVLRRWVFIAVNWVEGEVTVVIDPAAKKRRGAAGNQQRFLHK